MKKLFILFLLLKSYCSYSQFASFEHAQILEKGRVGIIGSYSVYRGYSGSRSYTTNTSTGIQLESGAVKILTSKSGMKEFSVLIIEMILITSV
jgi:hypothetical protein